MNWAVKCRTFRRESDDPMVHEAIQFAEALYGLADGTPLPLPPHTHPLTGSDFPNGLTPPTSDAISARAGELGSGEGQVDFLRLWRCLPDPRGVTDLSVQAGWRFAEHTTTGANLWDFLSLASALAGVAHPAIVQFNLADVQPFVTRARRTQDLWAGSYLLSFFCWQVMQSLSEQYGPDCILQPVLREQPLVDLWLRDRYGLTEVPEPDEEALLVANIPNIFTAILPYGEVEIALSTAIQRARCQWAKINQAVRDQVARAARRAGGWDAACEALWKRQEEDFLSANIFWAALELTTNEDALKEYRSYLPHPREENPASPSDDTNAAREEETFKGDLAQTPYAICSQLCAILLSDRKRARGFGQVDEPGVKCSLSGTLQALAPEGKQSLAGTGEWWKQLSGVRDPRFKMAGRVRPGDQLATPFLVKRLMMQAYFDRGTGIQGRPAEPTFDRHQFPSTAGMANAHCLLGIARVAASPDHPDLLRALCEYTDAVTNLMSNGEADRDFFPASSLPAWERWVGTQPQDNANDLRSFFQVDGDFLYEEFYDEARFYREYGRKPDPGLLKKADEKRSALLSKAREADPKQFRPPTRYYAIIAMDGDSMGAWISGKRPDRTKAGASADPDGWAVHPLTPGTHQAFTSALSGFALRDARRVVEEGNRAGKLIYAGGDDVLAVVPLDDLLPTLRDLYRAFRGDADNPGFTRHGDGPWELRLGTATLSAGAVIVHESLPLTFAMEQARVAERRAKDDLGRDAFAVTLLKRSGAPIEAGMRWRVHTPVGAYDVIDGSLHAIGLLRSGVLSNKIAHDLGEDPIGTWKGVEDAASSARRAEFERRARRHLFADKQDDSDVRRFLTAFTAFAAETGGWDRAVNLLLVLRVLAGGRTEQESGEEGDDGE